MQDTSDYVVSFADYLYGDNVAELAEDPTYKLSLTNSAGRVGKRIGENFQDLKPYTITGELTELPDNDPDFVPLRKLVQLFRTGHRAELGKQKLVLNSAADGRPAEYVLCAVESIGGLKWTAPINRTDFEVRVIAEPEIWCDEVIDSDLLQNSTSVTAGTQYTASVVYAGPDADIFADAEGVPQLKIVVSSVTSGKALDQIDPAYVSITHSSVPVQEDGSNTFILYPDAAGTFFIDTYEEGIRKGSTWAAGALYEFCEYDEFITLTPTQDADGSTNTFVIVCHNCAISAATMQHLARHW